MPPGPLLNLTLALQHDGDVIASTAAYVYSTSPPPSLGPRPFLYVDLCACAGKGEGQERKGLGTRLSSRSTDPNGICGCQIFISTPQRTVARSGQPWLLYEGGSKFCQALPHRGPGSGLEG